MKNVLPNRIIFLLVILMLMSTVIFIVNRPVEKGATRCIEFSLVSLHELTFKTLEGKNVQCISHE